jgi:hypothetical protein
VRRLDQAVGECRFAVVDVGNDAEVANVLHGLTLAAGFGPLWVSEVDSMLHNRYNITLSKLVLIAMNSRRCQGAAGPVAPGPAFAEQDAGAYKAR